MMSKQQHKIKEDLNEEELLRLREERKECERKEHEQDQLKRYGVVTYRKQPSGRECQTLTSSVPMPVAITAIFHELMSELK
jgi:hypothetical protein